MDFSTYLKIFGVVIILFLMFLYFLQNGKIDLWGEPRRFFQITFLAKADLEYTGSIFFAIWGNSHPSRDYIKKCIAQQFPGIGITAPIVILGIHEFKSESDYKNYAGI